MLNDTELLLMGAGIALVSSLFTSIVAALITYFFEKRKHKNELAERLFFLTTKSEYLSLDVEEYQKDSNAYFEKSEKELENLKNFVNEADNHRMSALIGMIEAGITRNEKARDTIATLKQEVEQLRQEYRSLGEQATNFKESKEEDEG